LEYGFEGNGVMVDCFHADCVYLCLVALSTN
jgi:hypothetical protein